MFCNIAINPKTKYFVLQRIFKNLASKFPSMTQSAINLLHSVITVLVDAQKKEVITAEGGQISLAPDKTLVRDGNTHLFQRRYNLTTNFEKFTETL